MINAKKILKNLRGESDRSTVSLYLSQSILKEFKDCCGEIPPSKVIEDLMKDFIESYSESKAKPKKMAKKN